MSDSSLHDEVCTECGATDAMPAGDIVCPAVYSPNDSQIKGLMNVALTIAQSKGFMGEGCNFLEQCSLIHSEVSEAVEAYREDGLADRSLMLRNDFEGKPIGVATEMADAVLRIFNTCARFNIPLEEAIYTKVKYNQTRPLRHGGKHESS